MQALLQQLQAAKLQHNYVRLQRDVDAQGHDLDCQRDAFALQVTLGFIKVHTTNEGDVFATNMAMEPPYLASLSGQQQMHHAGITAGAAAGSCSSAHVTQGAAAGSSHVPSQSPVSTGQAGRSTEPVCAGDWQQQREPLQLLNPVFGVARTAADSAAARLDEGQQVKLSKVAIHTAGDGYTDVDFSAHSQHWELLVRFRMQQFLEETSSDSRQVVAHIRVFVAGSSLCASC